jgi:hypothetical protein
MKGDDGLAITPVSVQVDRAAVLVREDNVGEPFPHPRSDRIEIDMVETECRVLGGNGGH